MTTTQETVLIVGSTGNVGVAATIGALRSGRKVLAVVRNQASAEKLFHHVGTKEGITVVEADVTSYESMQRLVERVEKGELPAFQHVYASAGARYSETPLKDMTIEEMNEHLHIGFRPHFIAYRTTIHYLLALNYPHSTWTICTGAQGDLAQRAGPSMYSGALYSLSHVAGRENLNTNVRFNEVYLGLRVEYDEDAVKHGVVGASEFAGVYEKLLKREHVRSSRVRVVKMEHLEAELRVEAMA